MALPKSHRMRVAVIGCGAWGRNHVRTFAALGALGAVCDLDARVAGDAAAAAGVPAAPLDGILADPAIDAVVVATPDATHAAVAAAALAAAKHVLVEKPMAMAVADAKALAARAREAGRVLMVGHILRYHPAFLRLEALAREGALGPLAHVSSKRLHLAGGAPRHALWDLAPHDVSMVLALAGRLPVAVRAQGAAPGTGAPVRLASLALDFGAGLTADIALSAVHPVKLHQICVSGGVAQAVFEDSRPWGEKLALHRPGLVPTPGAAPTRWPVAVTPGEPLAEEARAFLAAIDGGPAPASGPEEGLSVIRVLAACARALETGRSVPLDSATPEP
jgi:UDP-2-acetamido-3-amino-2,3-dideoxy-glucuronate N-acetyltransferase